MNQTAKEGSDDNVVEDSDRPYLVRLCYKPYILCIYTLLFSHTHRMVDIPLCVVERMLAIKVKEIQPSHIL